MSISFTPSTPFACASSSTTSSNRHMEEIQRLIQKLKPDHSQPSASHQDLDHLYSLLLQISEAEITSTLTQLSQLSPWLVFALLSRLRSDLQEHPLLSKSLRLMLEKCFGGDTAATVLKRHQDYLAEAQQGVFHRKYPGFGNEWGKIDRTTPPLFADPEILKISRIKAHEFLAGPEAFMIKKSTSEHGKTVFQQESPKTCHNTCYAMLLADLNLPLDLEALSDVYLTHPGLQDVELIQETLHVPVQGQRGFLEKLQIKIQQNGPVIFYTTDGDFHSTGDGKHRIGRHYFICDQVSDDMQTVRIRDPWHGWEIILDAKIFYDTLPGYSWKRGELVRHDSVTTEQIQKKPKVRGIFTAVAVNSKKSTA